MLSRTVWGTTVVVFALVMLLLNTKIEHAHTTHLASIIEQSKLPTNYQSKTTKNLKRVDRNYFFLDINGTIVIVDPHEVSTWIEKLRHEDLTGTQLIVSYKSIRSFLIDLAPSINVSPINAKLGIRDGKIYEKEASQAGLVIDIEKSSNLIAANMTQGRDKSPITTTIWQPDITASKAAELGITTLIGSGVTYFKNSPYYRIHNIKIGSQRLEGSILSPGEEFSFNDTMAHNKNIGNYLPAPVIKNGRVVMEYGGGLCQVSTTLYRSVITAGLDIIERRSHSLPVSYYSPQGYDATVYPGVVDLRFVNNTPGYILVSPTITSSGISVDIYGTNDGREVSVGQPVVYSSNDSGAFKTVMTRTIKTATGETKKEKFYSDYRSPITDANLRNPLE